MTDERTEVVKIKLTVEEKQKLEKIAKQMDLTLPEYIRLRALKNVKFM